MRYRLNELYLFNGASSGSSSLNAQAVIFLGSSETEVLACFTYANQDVDDLVDGYVHARFAPCSLQDAISICQGLIQSGGTLLLTSPDIVPINQLIDAPETQDNSFVLSVELGRDDQTLAVLKSSHQRIVIKSFMSGLLSAAWQIA